MSIDLSSIPSVLDKNRRPLGYVDAAELKTKWQAGLASPVRSFPLPCPVSDVLTFHTL